MPDRAALYLRVSSDEQRNTNLSVANQLQQCLAFVKRRGYSLFDCGRYVDDLGQNASQGTPAFAENASARNVTMPALLNLLSAAKTGAFDVMVAMDVTRVSRGEPFLLGALRKQLKDYGVRLEYVSTTGDKRTDTVMESMHAISSFFENDDRSRRTRQGKRQSAQDRRRHTGPPPFGYTTDANKQLALDPKWSPVARIIFEAYLNGSSLRQIARDLTAQEVPPAWAARRGNTVWASQTIGNILKNPVYRGTYIFGVQARIEGKLVDADRAKRVEITCPALVTADEWYAVQARLAESAAMVRNHPTTHTYALRGRIFCADCGRAYVGQWNGRNKRIEYRHRTRDGGCRHHAVSGQIEQQVLQAINRFQLEPERARQRYEEAIKQHREEFGHVDDMLASAKAERGKQTRSMDKLTATYLDPDMQMSKSRYIGLKDGIANKIDALDRQIINLNKERKKSPLPTHLEDFETWYLRFKVEVSDEELTPKEEARIVEEIPLAGLPPNTPEQKHQFLVRMRERMRTPKRLAVMYDRLNVRVEVGPGREPMVTIMGQSTTSN